MDILLKSLARHSELVDKEATSIDIVESQLWPRKAHEEVAKQEQSRNVFQLQTILQWLNVSDYQQEELERLLQLSHKSSCDWLATNKKIQAWIKTGNELPVLWMKGIPGSGMHIPTG